MFRAGALQKISPGRVLDTFGTNALGAYSFSSQLRYGVPLAFRVRRGSDNAELDIGFLSNGLVNETAITSHIGISSGFISVLYDQSTTGLNLVQATATAQPRIALNGVLDRSNGVLSALFSGEQSLSHTAAGYPFGNSARNLTVVYQPTTVANTAVAGYGTSSGSQSSVLYRFNGSDPYASGFGADAPSGFPQDTLQKISSISYEPNIWRTYRNGVAGGTANAALNTVNSTGFTMGGTVDRFVGYISELIFHATVLTTQERLIQDRNQGFRYGIIIS